MKNSNKSIKNRKTMEDLRIEISKLIELEKINKKLIFEEFFTLHSKTIIFFLYDKYPPPEELNYNLSCNCKTRFCQFTGSILVTEDSVAPETV